MIDVRPTLVKDRENMTLLADELRKDGFTTIDKGDGSIDVYRDGKRVRILRVRTGIA